MSKFRMSKSAPWGLGLAVGLGLVVTLSASMAIGHRATVDQAPAPHDTDNTTIGKKTYHTVVQEFSGSLYDTESFLADFMQSFNDQGLGEQMAGFSPTAVVVLTSEPVDDQASGYIGFTVPRQLNVGSPLEYQRLSFSKAVSYNHVGSYEELCPIYYEIEAGTADSGAGQASLPVVLELIDDPRFVSAPRTKMVIPLRSVNTPT